MLILASSSPRRAELLSAAGIKFIVRVSDVDETALSTESPHEYVLRLSYAKAKSVARSGELVLGADTIVVIDNQIAGKPADTEDARRMLCLLSGKWHEVLTAVTLINGDQILSDVVSTRVKFADLSGAEIDWYIATGEPADKAGAYGIQGFASRFVERIDGSYSNVVGLPVQLVYRMLQQLSANSVHWTADDFQQ